MPMLLPLASPSISTYGELLSISSQLVVPQSQSTLLYLACFRYHSCPALSEARLSKPCQAWNLPYLSWLQLSLNLSSMIYSLRHLFNLHQPV